MALAVIEARDLIKNAHIEGIDRVYAINIPDSVVGNKDETIVRISDVATNPDLYGSDDFHAVTREVEVQTFYALHPAVDPEIIDLKLLKLFQHNGWDLGQSHGHTLDPQTKQLTNTFYVYNFKLIK